MRAQRLAAAAGLRWIGEAFAIFRVAPLRQLVFSLPFLLAILVLPSLRAVGFVLVWLLIPALAVGPHAIARTASRGGLPDAALAVAGFRSRFRAQLQLGGAYLACMVVVLAITMLVDDGRFARVMLGLDRLGLEESRNPAMWNAMLLWTSLQTLLLAALWYAPLLVAWRGLPVAKAAFFSAAAMLINWRAFLLYGAGMTLLFAFVLVLALIGATLFGGSLAVQATAAGFAVIWTLLPVWFASSYLSYRDVFVDDDGAADGPPKSPTIPA